MHQISRLFIPIIILALLPCPGQAAQDPLVKVRSFDHRDFTRVVFESEFPFQHEITEKRQTILFSIDRRIDRFDAGGIQDDSILVDSISATKRNRQTVFEIKVRSRYRIQNRFVLNNPHRVVIDLVESTQTAPASGDRSTERPEPPYNPPAESARSRETTPPASKTGQFTLQTVCIDPGHGGNDIGAEGQSGLLEKDLTLAIGRKLRDMITQRRGINVILTRDGDDEISLNQRAAIANNNRAELFISIHINGSYRQSVRGPEIYFASLKATDAQAFDLAQRENLATGSGENQPDDTLNMILWNMAQTQHIKESSLLAEAVQEELNVLLDTVNRGVKQAPFRVLMRANMPSVLIEVAFITNPAEEKKLSRNSFLDQVAAAIYRGIEKYMSYHSRGSLP